LLRQEVLSALLLAVASAGNSIAAKIAMMAMTTNNSISVKADRLNNFPLEETEGRIDKFSSGMSMT